MTRRYGRGRRRRKEARCQERRVQRKAASRELKEAVQERLQLSLDREEVLGLLRDSLDVFAIEIGRRVAVGLLEDEVEQLCGPRHEWGQEGRTATRYGRQQGYLCIGGQKTRIQRPRVRSTAAGGGEVPLERYGQLQRPEALPQAFLRRMVRGVSTRDYEGVIDQTTAACGVQKSSRPTFGRCPPITPLGHE